jgi:hypothetical protein
MPRGHDANRDSDGRYAKGQDPGPGLPPHSGGGSSGSGGCLVLIACLAAAAGSFFVMAIAILQ